MNRLGVLLVVIVAQFSMGWSFQSTAPAFLWSSHQDRTLDGINYQTLSPKDLAKSVMSLGGWSEYLCSRKESHPSVDIALLFVGRELQSLDISTASKHSDVALLKLLKDSFTKSNHSLAFPYVVASEEEDTMASSLVSEFAETCGHALGASNVAFTESCSVKGENYEKLANIQSIHDFLALKMETRSKEQANLIVVCNDGSSSLNGLDKSSESQVFSEVISSVEHSGAKFSALYVSDPFKAIRYPSERDLQRFLAEGPSGSKLLNSTSCDEVCRLKASLLEGLFVGIVLLIILISGLCCMAGIDTPTRFEAAQDS
ncbi:hypothetical protein ACET3Z_024169 [Daucus carota]